MKKNKKSKNSKKLSIDYRVVSPRDTPEIRRFVLTIDAGLRDYADAWQASARTYEKMGLYRHIGEMMEGEGLWVDLGVGAGNLIATAGWNGTIAGIDNNLYLLRKARERLVKENHDVNLNDKCTMFVSDGLFREGLNYAILPRNNGDYFSEGKTNLFLDDIALLSPSRYPKADLVTYNFPGVPSSVITREQRWAAYHEEFNSANDKDRARILENIDDEISEHAFKAARKILKPGGTLIYVARVRLEEDSPIEEPKLIGKKAVRVDADLEEFKVPLLEDDFSILDRRLYYMSLRQSPIKMLSARGEEQETYTIMFKFRYEPK